MAAQVAVHVARLEHGSAEFVRAEAQHLLRRLLALRLGCAPAEIAVVRGQDGKPRLRGGELEFSVSRRARWCAVALSADCAVGVDLEPVHAFAGMDDVAAAFFPPPARAAYAAAAPRERPAVFFRWWTRLEAAGKAAGCGLAGAAACLDRVTCRSGWSPKGIAVAVAGLGRVPLIARWHAPAVFPGSRSERTADP